MNVGRQRDMADAVEDREEIIHGSESSRRSPKWPRSSTSASRAISPVRGRENKTLADGDFAAGAHQGVP